MEYKYYYAIYASDFSASFTFNEASAFHSAVA